MYSIMLAKILAWLLTTSYVTATPLPSPIVWLEEEDQTPDEINSASNGNFCGSSAGENASIILGFGVAAVVLVAASCVCGLWEYFFRTTRKRATRKKEKTAARRNGLELDTVSAVPEAVAAIVRERQGLDDGSTSQGLVDHIRIPTPCRTITRNSNSGVNQPVTTRVEIEDVITIVVPPPPTYQEAEHTRTQV